MDDTISILVASCNEEDQENILTALSEQMNFLIIGTVNDESGVIIKTEFFKPDILILDLMLSEINGLDLVRIIRRRSPSTAIIILNDKDNQENIYQSYAILAVMAGISGFLIKKLDIDKLAYIVKIIFMGGNYINPSITYGIFSKSVFKSQFPDNTGDLDISPTERSIITLLANGLSDSKIAEKLNYSMGTIRNCITNLRHKIKIKSRIEIVVYSLLSGLIRPEHITIRR